MEGGACPPLFSSEGNAPPPKRQIFPIFFSHLISPILSLDMGFSDRFRLLRRPGKLSSFGAKRASRGSRRSPRLEALETRSLLSGVPWGAAIDDTAEYLLGDVHVNVVFLESNGVIDPSTEDWTPQQIAEVKQKVVEGVNWWKEQLDALDTVHELNFHFDFTYADQPFQTKYEPISRVSQDFRLWVGEFLDSTGFGNLAPGDAGISKGIRAFNHQQRVESNSQWGFTIFVVDDENDLDGRFAPGSDFSRAFAFAGGRFLVSPASRPASTFAHEMGHIFYALDEHSGGGGYTARRGYYDTQNLNATIGHPDPSSRVVSIMDNHEAAYPLGAISPSAMEMVGWRDSDGDGIFDVLDVPLSLTGSGGVDPATGQYRFVGQASVGVLPNLNQSSLRSDITINQVSRIQYRVDDGPWTDALTPHAYQVDLDFSFPVPAGEHTIAIRALDDATNQPGKTGVMSANFQGTTSAPTSTPLPGINGFLWNDLNANGVRDAGEPALANWTIEIRGPSGQQLDLQQRVEPDDYGENFTITNSHPGVKLSSSGTDLLTTLVHVASRNTASTGGKVFSHQLPASGSEPNWSTEWIGVQRELIMEFTEPVTTVSIDAIGVGAASFARLEIYDANNVLIERITSSELSDGEAATLTLSRPTAVIKSARAFGHAGTPVRLDHLRFGAATTATTDAHGAWSAPYLGSGNFRVEAVAPSGWNATTGGGSQSVSLAAGATVQNVTFGFHFTAPAWQNTDQPTDVNRDGVTNLTDLLLVVQHLRYHGFGAMSGEPEEGDPRIDVNGDGMSLPLDRRRAACC
jgi:hypothetical protein